MVVNYVRVFFLFGSAMAKVNHSDEHVEFSDVLTSNPDIMSGGHWRPTNCVPRYRVAIIIPYRDRLSHLIVLLAHLIPVLKRQDLDFRIFVVEQTKFSFLTLFQDEVHCFKMGFQDEVHCFLTLFQDEVHCFSVLFQDEGCGFQDEVHCL
ncbi:hypothetical protein LOTGIDRAFT_161077 [Lottia gigantea]|uniref:Galactosyltransferase N-terminal domain-containing protein n=1 Tax=Lottia gigantea TaxID=225164 RepID=V4AI19_LOTGI|nr:hypothetical protein LOTGIDRAFT_161077 [Lottia gigantea]ESO94825.1 hypothetical protein LOTGIDRAFT_161077 [Lottia gigantea]